MGESVVDPWNMEVQIIPSTSLIQQFQDWDHTKSSVKKLCSFNRAKQWIALLLNRPIVTPNGHKMRLVDHLAAIDHMARAHRSGVSHDDYLRSCLAPTIEKAKDDTNYSAKVTDNDEDQIDTNVKVVINDAGKTEEPALVPVGAQNPGSSKIQNPNDGIQNANESIISPNEGKVDNAYRPICASIWKGVACEKTNCPRAHPSRCKDPNCLVLDQGLPRYKILQCNNWHAEPRSKKKKKKGVIPNSRTSQPRVKKPVPKHVNMSGPSTSKRTHVSSPQVSAPWTWPKPVAPFPFPNIFSTNHPGNESAAWSTPSLGGSQTTWEAMIRSDPSQKFNLAMEVVKMISQL